MSIFEKIINNIKRNLYSYLGILIMLVFVFAFTYKRIRFLIDDDVSSEMILGHLLWTEGKIFMSPNWIYSTEIRLFNMQAIYAVLFKYINSWFQVRVLTTTIIAFAFAILLFIMCKTSKLDKYFLLILICFFMPLGYDSLYGTAIVLSYWVYTAYTFAIMALYFAYHNHNNIVNLLLSFVVSVAIGAGGSRFFLSIYLPMLATSLTMLIIEKDNSSKNGTLFSSISFFGAICGFAYYKTAIEGKYIIPGLTKVVISPNVEKILIYFKCLLSNYGFGLNLLSNILSWFLLIISIFGSLMLLIKHNRVSFYSLSYSLFYLYSVAGMGCCLVLSTIPCESRYVYGATIFAIPVLFSLATEIKKKEMCSISLILIIMGSFINGGFKTYSIAFNMDKTSELDYIQSQLVEKGYKDGYSFFWSNNVLTELSNGEIDMRCLGFVSSTSEKFKNIEEPLMWLQRLDHMNTAPNNEVFMLLSNEAKEKFLDLTYYFDDSDIVLETNNYIVYGFDTYKELKEKIGLN